MSKSISEIRELVAEARRIHDTSGPLDMLCEAVEELATELERVRGQYSGPVVHQDLSEADCGFGVREAPMPRPR
jgi:hypothetical protein